MADMKHALNWIGGEWVDADKISTAIDPATSEEIGTFADASKQDAQRAIDAARRSFRTSRWSRDRHLRARVLNQLADAFERNAQALIDLLCLNNGKVRAEAELEVFMVPAKLRFYAAVTLTEYGRALEPLNGTISMVLRQPIGVAGIIVPWNSPIVLMIRSLAPALAAGTTAVIKFPGQTALVNHKVMEVMAEAADLPDGVVNAFTETGYEGSALLVDSPDVPTISFTGSTRTGRSISEAGAKYLKRFGLELGGKTPLVMFDDARLEDLAPLFEKALTVFAGQFCMTGSRWLVQKGIADRFRDLMAERMRAIKVGPASDPASDMGPQIDKGNVERIDRIVEDAIAKGAKPIVRGGPVTEGELAKGAFYQPAMLEVSDPKMAIVQEETFGPVVTMQVFETEEEAVALANDSEYGLAAGVYTQDVNRAFRVAREIDAGTVWINEWAKIYDEFEEGGFKQSGQGRMNGLAVMDDFVEYKHITLSQGVMFPPED
ncbi:aldehyde dehydrogenase family protein [Paracoccus stylophorae]|uniref:Aldehyde dehydrogenase family protein n=1 Tax=Paracoccus stylophorae TaxID=659350 RepID=A0ABY7SWY9_9RHOB|nr:aldehyde dehydrogenase family protein [Paracoccus stylophorae]WCR10462.1 aldehyde dehydrogenase family protein [Paracoccus stylophorae]